MMPPLDGFLVLDFSTLLPGPLATLLLAEAGAQVIKIERPQRGDEMRSYMPKEGDDSINFHMLNRGKRSIAIDLKAPDARDRLTPLIKRADVLIEQFRPGVMERLGFGYEAVRALNPRLIYCSISGWGQSGPKSETAAHDLNYIAETGILSLSAGSDGAPVVPPVLVADIAGGTYPAIINILLALMQREKSGLGTYIDVAMGDNLFTFAYWGLGNGFGAGAWPKPGRELVTGGSPRYHIYRTSDDRFLAVAPLEDRFWQTFCELIELPAPFREDSAPPSAVIAEVEELIGTKSSAYWRQRFDGQDVCCSIVQTLEEAVNDPHFRTRGVFDKLLSAGGRELPALPVPISQSFRSSRRCASAPRLGEDTECLTEIPFIPGVKN